MGLYRAEGIVLANRNLGESDRVVTLLCREQGKLEAVARGARRPRNRLVGLTLPFNVLQMSLFAGRGLDEFSQAEGVRSFQVLREDLIRLAYASYLAELVRSFLPEREPNQPVLELLLQSLEDLETSGEPAALASYFELNLLDLAGFRPSLETCLACGRPPDQADNSFSPVDGGFYCTNCAPGRAGTVRLSGQAMAAMDRGLRGDRHFLVTLPQTEGEGIQRVLRSFIEVRVDRELRSLRFLTGILT